MRSGDVDQLQCKTKLYTQCFCFCHKTFSVPTKNPFDTIYFVLFLLSCKTFFSWGALKFCFQTQRFSEYKVSRGISARKVLRAKQV